MIFPSIDIQGSILSNDLPGKIRSEQATFQQGKDFNPDITNAKLKDEISLAWQEAKGQWTIYKSKLTRLKDGESGTTETCDRSSEIFRRIARICRYMGIADESEFERLGTGICD